MASNDSTLLDGNGVSSDWIELYNAGDQQIDLAGWHLSDNATNLTKWTFPNLPQSELAPGEFRIVFASGTGVPDSDGQLHTNFKLSAGGEYLGLSSPGGVPVNQFGDLVTDYPSQFADVSYGRQVIDNNAGPITYVDADVLPGGNTAGLPGNWVTRGDVVGQAPFANGGSVLQGNGSVNLLTTTTSGLDQTQTYEVYAFFWDATGGGLWNIQAGLESDSLRDIDPSSPDVFLVDAASQIPGSEHEISGLDVVDDFEDFIDGNRQLYAAKLGLSSGSDSISVFVDHDTASSQRTWYDGIGYRISERLILPNSDAEYLIPADDSLGRDWTEHDFDGAGNGFIDSKAAIGYENSATSNDNYIGLFETGLPSGTVSTYLRIPFHVHDATEIVDLSLDAKFDDGIVLYLNGDEVARRRAPSTLNHLSIAASSQPDSQAIEGETISLTPFLSSLADGENTLAVQLLNRPNSSDYLFAPELTALSVAIDQTTDVYFDPASPGSLGTPGVLGFVGDTSFSVDRGFYDTAFDVTVSTDTPGATIYVTTDGSRPEPTNTDAAIYNGPLTITKTTNLRAAAYLDGYRPSNVDTQTYLFLDNVLSQDPRNDAEDPREYPQTWQGGFTGDYEVDARVVNQWADDDPLNTDFGIRESLQSIPTISLTLDHDELWNEDSGIYPNATSRGEFWERLGSVEYFDPNTNEEFQANVGLVMHGNASRFNARLLKHSFRLKFSSRFDGPGRLNFPLFDNTDFDDINQVILRASFTDSFPTRTSTNRYSPLESTYLRDVWMRDTQLATGSLAASSAFAHLYINGLYWGMYSPAERSADDQFWASHRGGEPEDWDVMKDFDELGSGERSVWDDLFTLLRTTTAANADQIYFQIQGKGANGVDDPMLPNYLNMDTFVDYMALHIYGGVEDWPSHNWHAGRNRVNPGKGFEFATWDQEIALDQLGRDRTEANDSRRNPAEIYQTLQASSEFRLKVADRIHQLMENEGPLSIQQNQERWMARVNQTEAAIIGESARWGDAREGQTVTAYTQSSPFGIDPGIVPTGSQTVPLMTVQQWRQNVDYVRDTYMVEAAPLFLTRMQSDGMLSAVDAPSFAIDSVNQHGGVVVNGSSLSIDGGTVYFTTDGTDPRAAGGAIAGTLYSMPLSLESQTEVNARVLSNGGWSALSSAVFEVIPDDLLISEINYHPQSPTLAESTQLPGVSASDFEFIELVNRSESGAPIVLSGATFTDGVGFEFPQGTQLAFGQRLVVAKNPQAFAVRYPDVGAVLGPFLDGGLSDGGEVLTLETASGVRLLTMEYGDSGVWPIAADGDGGTLQLIDPENTPANELSKPYHWTANGLAAGSPSAELSGRLGVVVSEVLAHTDEPAIDAIELQNLSDTAIDIGGWWLSDAGNDLLKFQIATPWLLQPGQVVLFDESDFNPTPNSPAVNHFSLNAVEGDQVFLTQSANGSVLRFEDVVEFGATLNGQSLGRTPGEELLDQRSRLAPLANESLDAVNGAFAFSQAVISEVNYHPGNPSQAALAIDSSVTASDLEFIEVHNAGDSDLDLTQWRLRGEADFDFLAGQVLVPGSTLVAVQFDPSSDVIKRDAFRAHYGINANTELVGPLQGRLSNSHGVVKLLRPDSAPVGQPDVIPTVLEEELYYDDLAPWPTSADGTGESLHRTSPSTLAPYADSWRSHSPSPGTLAPPPRVESVVINDGNSNRSQVVAVQVAFDQVVVAPEQAFEIRDRQTGELVTGLLFSNATVDTKSVVSITFGVSALVNQRLAYGNSLKDGRYELTVRASLVNAVGAPASMETDHVFGSSDADRFFRLFGDSDGDGDVDGQDYGRFGLTFLKTNSDDGFNESLDFDGDGDVDGQDYGQFGLRFLTSI